MNSVEYKLARAEEQNAALRQKVRHCENEISRLSVRESHMRGARRVPLLQKRLEKALAEREELECRLAETRGKEARLSDEVRLLRKFVSLSENPELAEAARRCVEDERIQEDLKALGEQLGAIAEEREEYKKRALLSCEEAEYYREQCCTIAEEKKELEEYVRKLLAEQAATTKTTPLTSCGTIEQSFSGEAATSNGISTPTLTSSGMRKEECADAADEIRHLRQSLEEERACNEALRETIDALREQQLEQRRSSSSEERVSGPPLPSKETADTAGEDPLKANISALHQQLQFSQGYCTLMKNRWHELREQNSILLARNAELELSEVSRRSEIRQLTGECNQLKEDLQMFLKAKSLLSCHHNETAVNKCCTNQKVSTS